ncbi:MAG TPA: L-serine ammonia-lyase, iron-sulfur-dependent, subunit beta [Clostridiaceae bacterium]|nr:L-serine ammonia-lyase, iron-sulfur-dependent, subunit beta [Clostridiaceae bacterium]
MTIFQSVFDIIGPVMVGPSSSHTAGAVRIGLAARSIFEEQPDEVDITFYGSFGHTYKGHGTDLAIIAGLLGYTTESVEIRHAYEMAKEAGMKVSIETSEEISEHPNKARVCMKKGGRSMCVSGISTGGGLIEVTEIDGFNVHMSCDEPVTLIFHRDRPGLIARVTHILGDENVNVSQMEVSRKGRGERALMLLATDNPIPARALRSISLVEDVGPIIFLSSLSASTLSCKED